MKLEDLLKEDTSSCDSLWALSLILLLVLNTDFIKHEPRINVYINGDKVGE